MHLILCPTNTENGVENSKQALHVLSNHHEAIRSRPPKQWSPKATLQGKRVGSAACPPESIPLEMKRWGQRERCIWLERARRQISGGWDSKGVSAGILLAHVLFQFEARGVPSPAGVSPPLSLKSCLKGVTCSTPCASPNTTAQPTVQL